MKRFLYATGLLAFVLLSGCRSNAYLVDSNFKYDGKFSDYKTFGFVGFKESGLDQYYTNMVKNLVIRRLTSLGYHYDTNNPDLWITYKYLDTEMVLYGYNQSRLNTWVLNQQIRPDLEHEKSYGKNKVHLPSGSFILYIMESEKGEMIWLGYSHMRNLALHERNLISSVGMILDEYNVSGY